MPDFNSSAPAGDHEPVRWLASDASLPPALRELLVSPPPVKPLDAQVAMRVRGAVLDTPAPAAGGNAIPRQKGGRLSSSQPMAVAKLGAVAAGAALFGAGAMTLVSSWFNPPSSQFGSANDRSGVVVVSASRAALSSHQSSRYDAELEAARGRPTAATALAALASTTDAPGTSDLEVSARSINLTRASLDDNEALHPTTNGSSASNRTNSAQLRDSAPDLAGAALGASSANTVLSVDDLASADDALFHHSADGAASRDVRVLVRPAFRRIASASDANSPSHRRGTRNTPQHAMSSLEEETLLLEDARSKLARDPESALTLALKHQSQFRRGQLLEQRRMIHLEALLRLGRDKEALELAKSIGSSLYRARAEALLTKYGI